MTELLVYFGARGPLDLVLLLANGLIAGGIFLLLVLAHPDADDAFAAQGRIARYVLAAVYGVVALRVLGGWYYTPVEPTEVAVNALVLWQVWLVRGDISVLIRAIRALQARLGARK
ncbi:phage holin family protein [Variovorax sp. J22P168]|uniref:phage holin family protein n=1 Tax=Variovorax jilinensis TaxID=3053513 RepID=UPI00257893C2|nr:phage holin family protein [Variovorax sp. J22P168]MDM0011994.1 phage holin family protein [Variovorax sp. J22P168]